MSYAMRQTLHMPFQAALDHTIACLKHEGFGVLTNLDLQAIMKAKLGEDRLPYHILGACNPRMAHKVLFCGGVCRESRWN
eukprot:m.82329 g.82329  ORF g.82329 m.82329 type:complete len:80 (+) comp50772_c0_seq10:742-981(+)